MFISEGKDRETDEEEIEMIKHKFLSYEVHPHETVGEAWLCEMVGGPQVFGLWEDVDADAAYDEWSTHRSDIMTPSVRWAASRFLNSDRVLEFHVVANFTFQRLDRISSEWRYKCQLTCSNEACWRPARMATGQRRLPNGQTTSVVYFDNTKAPTSAIRYCKGHGIAAVTYQIKDGTIPDVEEN